MLSTNFSRINKKGLKLSNIEILKKRATVGDWHSAVEFYEGLSSRLRTVQSEMIKLIESIREQFPEKTIVLKVHPGEDATIYKEKFNKLSRVSVIENKNIIPLIIAADVLIHNSCTTSIEAKILGTPVISFIPFQSSKYDSELPNLLGKRCFSIKDTPLCYQKSKKY